MVSLQQSHGKIHIQMSQLMRLWHFSSSVNSFFKCPCAARCLIFGRTHHLLPYFMCANSEGSDETAQMRRLAWALAGRLCDKYHNLMSWLKSDYSARSSKISSRFYQGLFFFIIYHYRFHLDGYLCVLSKDQQNWRLYLLSTKSPVAEVFTLWLSKAISPIPFSTPPNDCNLSASSYWKPIVSQFWLLCCSILEWPTKPFLVSYGLETMLVLFCLALWSPH